MSLIPPVPIVLSKLKYHIKARYKDDPELENVLEKLGGYYTFKLFATFRSLENGLNIEYDDMKSYIESDITQWDCIDTALNMYTRLKIKLTESILRPGVLRLSIGHQPENPIVGMEDKWWDLYIDEIPLNVKGMLDKDGKEMTFHKPEEISLVE